MRFLPIVTQIFLWGAVFASCDFSDRSEAVESRLYLRRLRRLLPADDGQPGVFQHAGAGLGIAAQIRDGEIKKFLIQPID